MTEKTNQSVELRDYQVDMLERLEKAWKRNRSVMVQMPTGTGKTHLMAAAIRREKGRVNSEKLAPAEQGGMLVVTHRRELIEQISRTLDSFGIEHGLIVSGREIDETKQVQVASIQTLARREQLSPPSRTEMERRAVANCSLFTLPFSLIIIDEAHHALARTYRMLWDKWPKARFLGLTATPCRLNNAPFTDLFDTLLQSWSIQEFIDKGWLSDFEYVSASPDSEAMRRVRSLRKRGADGDYQATELATVMDVPESVEHLYRTYRQFAYGKKGIVYAINREHAGHIATYYNNMGVRCAVIDSKTPAEERRRIIEEYKNKNKDNEATAPPSSPEGDTADPAHKDKTIEAPSGAVRGASILVNVDIFSEGFDCPEVEFIQLARPTLSLSKYLQQVGRGMRVSPGKPHVLILDNVGLYQTFGLPTEERDWKKTFYGLSTGKGNATSGRYVVIDENSHDRELVNLEMVRIKKGESYRSLPQGIRRISPVSYLYYQELGLKRL